MCHQKYPYAHGPKIDRMRSKRRRRVTSLQLRRRILLLLCLIQLIRRCSPCWYIYIPPFFLRFRSFSWYKILFLLRYVSPWLCRPFDPRHAHYYIRYRDKSSEITTYPCRHPSSRSDNLFFSFFSPCRCRCSNIGRDDLTHSWHFIYLNYWGKPIPPFFLFSGFLFFFLF